jgi:hypothetical protein
VSGVSMNRPFDPIRPVRLGYRLSGVAAYFDRDTATVATLLARLSDRMQSDEKQRRKVDSLTKIVES